MFDFCAVAARVVRHFADIEPFFLPSSLFLLSVRGLDEDVIEYETDLLPVRSDWRIEHDVVGRPSHDPL